MVSAATFLASRVFTAPLALGKPRSARRASRRATAVMASSSVAPAIIVGGGRVGQALADMGVAGDVVMKRGDPFPSEPAVGPIFVCTRNDALEGVIDATPEARRKDLVFLQNGMLQPFLDARGLGGDHRTDRARGEV